MDDASVSALTGIVNPKVNCVDKALGISMNGSLDDLIRWESTMIESEYSSIYRPDVLAGDVLLIDNRWSDKADETVMSKSHTLDGNYPFQWHE